VKTNVGKVVSTADLRAAFEQTFGSGSADALLIECSKDDARTLISGISINLQGVLNQETKLQSILDISKHPKPQCTQGVIDPVGRN
jgi:ribonuclease T2